MGVGQKANHKVSPEKPISGGASITVPMSEDIETTAIHPVRKKGHGPMVEPIFMSSTWRLKDARQGADFSLSTAIGNSCLHE